MKKIFGTVVLALSMLLLLCSPLYAVPASPIQEQMSQPSGQKFNIRTFGDEKYNWTATESGDVVTKGTNGYWYYSQVTNKQVVRTNKRIGIDARPTTALKRTDLVNKLRTGAVVKNVATVQASGMPIRIIDTAVSIDLSQLQPVETQKILVLLVQFTNKYLVTNDYYWKNTVFGNTGSVNSYYKEVSGGRLQFAPAEETSGTANDGLVRVTLPYSHPNTGPVVTPWNYKITRDALMKANPYVNFAQFDTDNDGFISAKELHIVVIVAGFERSHSVQYPSVWGHNGYLWDAGHLTFKTELDGKGIGAGDHGGAYSQAGEMQGNHPATIGIICHELGHDLGLPNLYDEDYDSSGLGEYSLMAGGLWAFAGGYHGSSPTHLDAWSKMRLGFVNPSPAFNASQAAAANAGDSTTVQQVVYAVYSGKYNVIKIETSNPKEYFLIENRQLSGYDRGLSPYLASGGILILHIDESVTTKNNDQNHKLVDVEEANQAALGYSQLDQMKYIRYGSAFPKLNSCYIAGNGTKLDSVTNPNSKLYNGTNDKITVSSPEAGSPAMTVTISRNLLPKIETPKNITPILRPKS